MKKSYLILCCLSLSLMTINAQETTNCENNIAQAKELLAENSPFNDQEHVFELVVPCANAGDTEAENLLGIFYLKGIGTDSNPVKAFELIKSAAEKNHVNAQYNLGRMYKTGEGVTINFEKAIEWFEKAKENGNQRAAYSLGYMYYKGFGVPQDYEKALYWFERSEDYMAKHFLGLSYYLGYGVQADEDKALEILLTNPIINSETLVTYIKKNQKQKTEEAVAKSLDLNTATDQNDNDIKATIAAGISDIEEEVAATAEDMQGEWIGKLIQYDWSGKTIERVLPIELSFDTEKTPMQLSYTFLDKKAAINVALHEDLLYFNDDFDFTLDKLYSSNPRQLSLDYSILSFHLKKQEIANNTYLVGTIDTYINQWIEYGQPTRILLKRKDNGIDVELLEALAAQKNQFIKLYPVPFSDQLTIQYQLEKTAEVQVELVSLSSNNKIVIAPTTQQEAGDYTYTVPVFNSLKKGLYIVKVSAGKQLYTRLIIKEN